MTSFIFIILLIFWLYGFVLWISAYNNMKPDAQQIWMFTPFWFLMPSLFDSQGEVARVKTLKLLPFYLVALLSLVFIDQHL